MSDKNRRRGFEEDKRLKVVDKKKKSFLPVRNLGEIEEQLNDELLSAVDSNILRKLKEHT